MKQEIGARELALQVLMEVEQKESYVNLALSRFLNSSDLREAERALATELAYGVVTRLNTVDWRLALLVNRPLKGLTVPVRNILRLGLYQLMYMDRIPPRAVVDESVKLGHRYGHRGVAGLINAVLRRASREGEPQWPDPTHEALRHLELKYSHPAWLVKRWVRRYGLEEAASLCEANNSVPPLSVRVNYNKTSKEELVRLFQKEGVKVKESLFVEEGLLIKAPCPLSMLDSFRQGLFAVQGESAMLASLALGPLPGDRIADICSAPGGKATHLAQLIGNEGQVIAGDISAGRLRLVKEAAERLGACSLKVEEWDASRISEKTGLEDFDRVLLDAPCSGLGVIRGKPDLKWRKREKDLLALATLQSRMLHEAVNILRPGGVLLYCVCTNEPEEAEKVIESLLTKLPGIFLDDIAPHLPVRLRDVVFDRGMIHILPHRHSMDGFFMARLKKKAI